jgi:predicted N-acetyltransferase YhbS
MTLNFHIRPAREAEYAALGELIVDAYQQLSGVPTRQQCPEFWRQLRAVAERARHPGVTVYTAVDEDTGTLLGTVDFVDEATVGVAAIRLLAVATDWRGHGVGRALTRHCLRRARLLGRADLILESRSLPCRIRRVTCLCRVGNGSVHSSNS